MYFCVFFIIIFIEFMWPNFSTFTFFIINVKVFMYFCVFFIIIFIEFTWPNFRGSKRIFVIYIFFMSICWVFLFFLQGIFNTISNLFQIYSCIFVDPNYKN